MRRRRTSRSRHNKDRSGAVTTVLVLLLIAAFIFAFQSLGIYDLLFKPAYNPGTATVGSASPSASATTPAGTGVSASPQATPGGERISEEIKMNAITLYGVQLGVFTKQENAEASSVKFKKDGSAGYILKEEALYRIVDSVFYTEGDAKVLRDEYRKGISPDACILRVQASGINWKVNATREQLDAIRGAVSTLQSQLVLLINTQKAAQQNQGSADDWKAAVTGASTKLKQSSDDLMKAVGNTNSDVILKLNGCLLAGSTSLDQLAKTGSSDSSALLSGLKYSIIDILLKLQRDIMG